MGPEPRILRETAPWLVLDKPAGWHAVAQPRTDGAPSVEAWLARERPELDALDEHGLVHRLDRGTSGCLVVARTPLAQRALREAFSGRPSGHALAKRYLALVADGLDETGSWRLHFTSRHRGSAKVTVSQRGEPVHAGRCAWRVRWRSKGLALVEVELLGPGRRHQIRAGFAHLGHPLAGDALYGGKPLTGLDGAALHAWRLELDGTVVESPPPPWAAAMRGESGSDRP